MKAYSDWFDTLAYLRIMYKQQCKQCNNLNNVHGIECKNKEIPGKFKDELNGEYLYQFYGLRPKAHCIPSEKKCVARRAKGVNRSVLRNIITSQDYHECLFNDKTIHCEQKNIRSKLHELLTEKQTEIALSSNDEKRHLLPNNIDSLPYGHWKIADEDLLLEFLENEGAPSVEPPGVGETDSTQTPMEGVEEERLLQRGPLIHCEDLPPNKRLKIHS